VGRTIERTGCCALAGCVATTTDQVPGAAMSAGDSQAVLEEDPLCPHHRGQWRLERDRGVRRGLRVAPPCLASDMGGWTDNTASSPVDPAGDPVVAAGRMN